MKGRRLYQKWSLALASLSLLLVSSLASAQSTPTLSQLSTFRTDFNRLLDDYEVLAGEVSVLNYYVPLVDPSPLLARARAEFDGLATEDLVGLYRAVEAYPAFWSSANDLSATLANARARLNATPPPLPADRNTCNTTGQDATCSNCPSNRYVIRDQFIAQGVAVIGDAVFGPIPDSLDIPVFFVTLTIPHPAKIIVGLIVFIVKEVEVGIAGEYAVNDSCETTYRRRIMDFYVDEVVSSRASADSVAAISKSIEDFKEEALLFDIEANMARRASRTNIGLYELPRGRVCRADSNVSCVTDADCMVCNSPTLPPTCTQDSDCGTTVRDKCLNLSLCVSRGIELVHTVVADAIQSIKGVGMAVDPGADAKLLAAAVHAGAGRNKAAYRVYRKSYRQAVSR